VKTVVLIVGGAVGAVVAFLVAMVVLVNMRGGLDPSRAGLARLPLAGGLFKVRAAPASTQEGEPSSAESGSGGAREIPFLRFGPEARLARLAQELELKKTEYDALLLQLERRERELEAWQRQMKVERDLLREKFAEEKAEIAKARDEMQRTEANIRSQQVAIGTNERINLQSTAEIYSRMSPDKGAQILTEMYVEGDQETVVKIIHLMEGRSAAKTLEAFTDPKISADITMQLKRVAENLQEGDE